MIESTRDMTVSEWTSYLYEYIQNEIDFFTKLFKLKRRPIVITNPEHCKTYFVRKRNINENDLYGSVAIRELSSYVFIDINRCRDMYTIKKTICHELLHLKYPDKPERAILQLEKKYID